MTGRKWRKEMRNIGGKLLNSVLACEMVEKLVDKTLSLVEGNSPLNIACRNGNEGTVSLLLKFGADVNGVVQFEGHCEWPLLVACKNGHFRVAQILLQQGAKVENLCVGPFLPQPIHYTCCFDSTDAVEVIVELLRRKPTLRAAKEVGGSRNWGTPLNIAMKCRNTRAIIALVSLYGSKILGPTKWVPNPSLYLPSKVRVHVLVKPLGFLESNIIMHCCALSGQELYQEIWKSYRFLELWWHGAVIFPGSQTLYDMGLRTGDEVFIYPEKVMSPWIACTIATYLPAPPPIYAWTPKIHHYFPKPIKDSILSFLIVVKRLKWKIDANLQGKVIQYISFGWLVE
eukprot:Phypoly_transcript_05341.p1 GENE.Phypoly_transcript_05341~~Phypoly_transcript_05341.p1  ORF type:complete len:342 (+),score=31.41 Phypoly_transcript_05341:918-1943(+)